LMQNHTIHVDDTPTSAIRLYLEDASAKMSFSRAPQASGKPTLISGQVVEESDRVVITVQIVSDAAKPACLECQMLDELGAVVGFGALGMFDSAEMVELQPGITDVSFSFSTTPLAVGNYYIDLDLTIPGVEFYDRAEKCLALEILHSSRTTSGKVLQSSWGRGSLDLSLQKLKLPCAVVS
jgi:lipopolysaccharide transport system ATP-binding protein